MSKQTVLIIALAGGGFLAWKLLSGSAPASPSAPPATQTGGVPNSASPGSPDVFQQLVAGFSSLVSAGGQIYQSAVRNT
jgi:hypothetical protein